MSIEKELRDQAEWRAANQGPFTKENLVEWRAADELSRLREERDEALAEIERMTPKFVAYEYLESPAGREIAEARVVRLEKALEAIRDEPEVHTKLNQERLCCKFQDIAARALSEREGQDG